MGLEFIEGNEDIARGAMQANCNFFAGYPIPPSSSILHHMLTATSGPGISSTHLIKFPGLWISVVIRSRVSPHPVMTRADTLATALKSFRK